MNEENPDWESTTAVIARRAPFWAWVREHFKTPASFWSTVGALLAAIGSLIGVVVYVVHAQTEFRQVQAFITQEQEREKKRDELLQQLVTGQAVMNGQLGSMSKWREGIEQEAEAPPHARRKR